MLTRHRKGYGPAPAVPDRSRGENGAATLNRFGSRACANSAVKQRSSCFSASLPLCCQTALASILNEASWAETDHHQSFLQRQSVAHRPSTKRAVRVLLRTITLRFTVESSKNLLWFEVHPEASNPPRSPARRQCAYHPQRLQIHPWKDLHRQRRYLSLDDRLHQVLFQ